MAMQRATLASKSMDGTGIIKHEFAKQLRNIGWHQAGHLTHALRHKSC